MPIFISHSQKDRDFADALAANLVKKKHHIWMDRWELNIGDSLKDRIRSVLAQSTAIIVLLSQHSVESDWCKFEIDIGLMRELAEHKTLLVPCIIGDCVAPTFLEDKVYADFRSDYDEALSSLEAALAKITNAHQARAETPEFHTDWSVDWKSRDGMQYFEWTFVDHGHDWPYVILSKCTMFCNPVASKNFAGAMASGNESIYLRDALETLVSNITPDGLTVQIEDAREKRSQGGSGVEMAKRSMSISRIAVLAKTAGSTPSSISTTIFELRLITCDQLPVSLQ